VPDSIYPIASRELAARRKQAAPETHDAFQAFSRQVFADGALPEKTKQLIAVAVAHVTQCPYCIRGHTRLAQRRGASEQEIMEAIWVAAEMRAGGAYAHSVIALNAPTSKTRRLRTSPPASSSPTAPGPCSARSRTTCSDGHN
jgi:AhpD family alkylhydroperoxidase